MLALNTTHYSVDQPCLLDAVKKLLNWGYAKFSHGDGIQIEIHAEGLTESKNNRNQKGNHETHFVFHSENVQSSKTSACDTRPLIYTDGAKAALRM